MTVVSGANALDEGNVPGFFTIPRESQITLASENTLQVQTGDNIRISAVTQGASPPGIKHIETGSDDDGPDVQFFFFGLGLKLDCSGRAASLAEVASLAPKVETKPLVENIREGNRFNRRRMNRLRVSGTDGGAQTTSDTPLRIDVPGLSNHFDTKIARLTADSLYRRIGQDCNPRMD